MNSRNGNYCYDDDSTVNIDIGILLSLGRIARTAQMRPILSRDRLRLSVVSVGRDRGPCKNGGTDRDAARGVVDWRGSKEHRINAGMCIGAPWNIRWTSLSLGCYTGWLLG